MRPRKLFGRGRTKVAFLVLNLDGMGGTSRSVITQANALAARDNVDVRLVSVTRSADQPHNPVDPRIPVDYLVDVRDGTPTGPSRLVPRRWDHQFFPAADEALERFLPDLDVDVLVTVTPALMAVAVQLAGPGVRIVHQEHRSSADRVGGLEPLLAFAPRAAAVALLTESTRDWLADQLGPVAPPLLVVPNPLPMGEQPRSPLDQRTIVVAGRVVPEKQPLHVVRAFASIAEDFPAWRLRILGDGPMLEEVRAQAAKLGLADRVELPGAVTDMPAQWARASICVMSSRTEGFPLVAQEAMSAGVPVISYDCPSGPRELITHDVSGLLVGPGSKAGLAGALRRLVSDDEARSRLGEGAFAASRAYAPDVLAARWEEVFTGLDALPRPERVPFSRQQGPTVLAPPHVVRREVVELVRDALAATGDGSWWVQPGTTPTVVVPSDLRDVVLAHLAARAPEHLSLLDPGMHGWPERRDTVAVVAARLRGAAPNRLVLGPWPRSAGKASPLAAGADVALEFWDRLPDGELVAPFPNDWTMFAPAGAATATLRVAGVELPTLPPMRLPTTTDVTFPVDVVWTWVDGDDPQWRTSRDAREGADTRREAAGDARFRSRDELRYSMRSVFAHAPWVRTLHLVTAGQRPDWLVDHPQVRVVDHREILPADALPTFNSQAIETALHKVPDLAEHFVYLNDDVFLARPLEPTAFFSAGGSFAAFVGDTTIGLPELADKPFLHAAHNNRRLLEESLGVTITRVIAHTPHPHRVSVLREICERFAEAVEATARSPFRSPDDVSLLSSLAQHYGLATGTAYVGHAEHRFVDLSNARVEQQLRRLRARDLDFFCVGDHHDFALDTEEVDAMLTDFLAEYFPVKAPWER